MKRIYSWILLVILTACSTTKNLPEGEMLYTGIKEIQVKDPDGSKAGDTAMQEVESALAYPPNNSLFGSSTKRIPLPMGLWVYNRYVNSQSKFGKWMFNRFAAKPVFISTVNPDVRVAVARNLLRENGYFDGSSSYQVIPDEKNPKKARINYTIEMNHAYTYDSIRYMRMRHYADTLIHTHMSKRMLHKGDNFNVVQLEAERQRIATLLRNNGFFYFRPNFIVYEADTLLTAGKVWLRVTRKAGLPSNVLRPYRIGNMSVHLTGFNNEAPTDSIRYKDLTIHYQGKLRIRPAVLYERLSFKPGDIYTQYQQQRTQTSLSRLSVFQYTEFQYTPQDTASRTRNNLLDLQINATYDLPLDGELEFNVKAKDNDYVGPGAVFSVTRRNAFHGGETFGVQLRGSYEWQTGNRAQDNATQINSYELGVSSTLTFPFILFPGYMYRDLVQPSSTTFRLSADLMNRARFFTMYSFGGSVTYDFRPTSTTQHSVTPFRLTYNKYRWIADFDSIEQANKGLAMSLKNQFIPAMSYSFTYDTSPVSTHDYFWWQSTITQSGNILGGIYAISGKKFNQEGKQILGNPFAQFMKATTEFRYNHRIDRNNRLVGRIAAGAIYSYGNARVSPYSEQFYVGGANSIRAFTIRSIGPGRFAPDKNNRFAYIDQTGDLKFEANLEYRFKVVGDLNGAVFFDAGGIWLIREDKQRPGGQLKKGYFLKDLATGTGAGLRYDLSFLVVRFDVGIGLHLPYDTGKSGYYNIPKFKDGIGWHIAIGYPF